MEALFDRYAPDDYRSNLDYPGWYSNVFVHHSYIYLRRIHGAKVKKPPEFSFWQYLICLLWRGHDNYLTHQRTVTDYYKCLHCGRHYQRYAGRF